MRTEATDKTNIRSSFRDQADLCREFGSPFTADLLSLLAKTLDRDTPFGAAILDWAGKPDALNDALPLRVSAAFHALARSRQVPELTAIYPPNPQASAASIRAALNAALDRVSDWLTVWLGFAPQTNEVARSSILYLGLMQIADRTNLPIRLFEIGSSAGLNLNLDRYGYEFAGKVRGDTNSPLRFAPEWSGSLNIGSEPKILDRRGCDIAPFDLLDEAERERLLAYIWPDQVTRMERMQQALALADTHPPRVDRGDAADWVLQNVTLSNQDGVATVLMHSIFWSYLPDDAQATITTHMEQLGQMATPQRPLGWIAFELGENVQPALTLRLWPGGETRLLAQAHPHCRQIDWKL
ncbi:MAG: DUF2332 domain-containing protein [Rhodobacteraceae bacterium]|nr:DUF2332 domain-containing protein [Paracoccaceae bacterium]